MKKFKKTLFYTICSTLLLLSACENKASTSASVYTGEPHLEVKITDSVSKYICGIVSIDNSQCTFYPGEYVNGTDEEVANRFAEINAPSNITDSGDTEILDWNTGTITLKLSENCIFKLRDEKKLCSDFSAGTVKEEYKEILFPYIKEDYPVKEWEQYSQINGTQFVTYDSELFSKIDNYTFIQTDYTGSDGRLTCWIYEIFVENNEIIEIYMWPMIG